MHFHLLRARAPLLLLAACCIPLAHAGSERLCEYTDHVACPSPDGCYNGTWQAAFPPALSDGYCWHEGSEQHSDIVVMFFNSSPPGTARLNCHYLPATCGWSCVAAPTGVGFTYIWSKPPSWLWAPEPQPHENAVLVFRNIDGRPVGSASSSLITVDVVSPSGTSSSASFSVPTTSCMAF